MTDHQGDTSVSLTDAASRLGISERTVLRRIKDGTIDGRKVGEGRGGVWRIYLSLSDTLTAPVSDSPTNDTGTLSDSLTNVVGSVSDSVSDSPTHTTPEMLKMIELLAEERRKVEELHEKHLEASNAAAHWQARAIAAEQTVQRLLPAPKDESEQPVTERVSWWKRLWSR